MPQKRRNPLGVKYSRAVNALTMFTMIVWGILNALLLIRVLQIHPNWTDNIPLMTHLVFLSFLCFAFGYLLFKLNTQLQGMQLRGRMGQIFLSIFFMVRDLFTPNAGMILYGASLLFMMIDPDTRRSFRPGPHKNTKGALISGFTLAAFCMFIFAVVHRNIGSMGIEGMAGTVQMLSDDHALINGRLAKRLVLSGKRQAEEQKKKLEQKAADTILESAGQLLDSKEWDLAIEKYQKLVKVDTVAAKAHLGLGMAFLNKGEYARAIEEAQKAIEKNPNFSIAYAILGRAYSESGDMEKGMMHLLSAVIFDPNFAEAHYYLGTIYCAKNNPLEAMGKYKKLQELGSPLAQDLYTHINQYCPQ